MAEGPRADARAVWIVLARIVVEAREGRTDTLDLLLPGK
jgi:hypothetical protein